jgi:hypothetical protein
MPTLQVLAGRTALLDAHTAFAAKLMILTAISIEEIVFMGAGLLVLVSG